ncbi:hypothetical protein [Elizabethkingia anophelis]
MSWLRYRDIETTARSRDDMECHSINAPKCVIYLLEGLNEDSAII